MTLTFRFEPLKTIQAIALLVREHPEFPNDVLDWLYLANRRSLEGTGSPIIGGTLMNLPHGPDLVDARAELTRELARGFYLSATPEGRIALAPQHPGDGELSDFDVYTLEAVRHERFDLGGMPEWNMPATQEGEPLSWERALAGVGVSEQEINAIVQREEAIQFMDRFAIRR